MATTVQELINYLNDIEDKDQAVIYQYYLAEHFDFYDGTPTPTAEQFNKAVEDLDCETLWDEAHDTLSDYLHDLCEIEEEEED